LDGRIARLTKSQSEFGIQYDSLVDLASFGLAPSILILKWGLISFERFGWTVAFFFFACGALRLARFNVKAAGGEKKYFQGLPIPLAAYNLVSLIIIHHHWFPGVEVPSYLVLPFVVVLALLMVSTIHYPSLKQIDFSQPASFIFLVVAAVVLVVLTAAPHEALFFISVTYMVMGPVLEMLHLRHRRHFLQKMLARKRGGSRDLLRVVEPPDSQKQQNS
jgi:CDP-diacylglycerol--serine O-phosphatidyltransferase